MAYKSFARKGDAVVQMNYAAIDSAKEHLVKIDIPADWATTTEGAEMVKLADNEYFRDVIAPILALEGDKLPSSAFNADGSVPTGTTKFEKRGVAVMVPKWVKENCVQCNQCSFVCPHACIRPALVADGSEKPETFETKPALGIKGYGFRMQVSPLDCMGCGVCADVCPGMKGNKALVMTPLKKSSPSRLRTGSTPSIFPKSISPRSRWRTSRRASSRLPCSSSRVHAQAAARPLTSRSSPSSSATE